MKVSFFKQHLINQTYARSLHDAIDQLIDGKKYLVGGQFSAEFEKKFSSYIHSKYFSLVSNGFDALLLACEAVELNEGDEVLVPCHTYVATWLAPLRFKCKLVAVPVKINNFLIDEMQIEKHISPRTKCIMPVHLYGNACNMNGIIEIAKRHNLYVIEDAAQAHGVTFNSQKIGSFGDFTCFSFYPTKNLGALGEAGGVAVNSKSMYEKINSLRNYGRSSIDGSININLGSNKRCDEIQAAFLSSKLFSLDSIAAKRRRLVQIYKKNLRPIADHAFLIEYQYTSSPHIAILCLKNASLRPKLMNYLVDQEISTAIHYKVPCHLQPFISANDLIISSECKKQAQGIADSIISLPLSEVHSEDEINYVCKKVISFFKESTSF